MPGKPYLGRDGVGDRVPKADRPSKRGIFSDPQYDSVDGSGPIDNPEHMAAIKKAMGPLYGGLAGSRCDPVEEWPGDADEAYGIPKKLKPLGVTYSELDGDGNRDDAPRIVTDKPGKPNRHIAASDLSGGTDRISNDDDFAERNQSDDDSSFTSHH